MIPLKLTDSRQKGKKKIRIIKLEREQLLAYTRQYINKNDLLYRLAEKIKPIDGYEDFLIHGEPEFVEYETTNGQWIQLSPEELSRTLADDPQYKGGNIRLISCKSGMLDNGFAQQLADILQVDVMAPTETLWVNLDGEMFITNNEVLATMWDDGEDVKQTGEWRVFSPRKGRV